MRLLLDTHAFLWWVNDSPQLSQAAREAIADAGNSVFFSVVSAWEMVIKSKLGKLGVPQSLSDFLTDQLQRNSFEILPVYLPHALQVADLPDYHRDPFDRLLIAQALIQNMRIVSGDPQIHRYPVDVVW